MAKKGSTAVAKAAQESRFLSIEPVRKETKSENFFSVYANEFRVQATPWDLRLILGSLGELTPEPPTIEITMIGEVRVSLQLAKRLVGVLSEQIIAYEERFGEIHVPSR